MHDPAVAGQWHRERNPARHSVADDKNTKTRPAASKQGGFSHAPSSFTQSGRSSRRPEIVQALKRTRIAVFVLYIGLETWLWLRGKLTWPAGSRLPYTTVRGWPNRNTGSVQSIPFRPRRAPVFSALGRRCSLQQCPGNARLAQVSQLQRANP